MKKIIESLFALGMLFATVGCDQDQIVAKFDTSGEDAGTAYFVKNAVSENFEPRRPVRRPSISTFSGRTPRAS